MNLKQIQEDIELATIDYSDRYKVVIEIRHSLSWMVYDRASKKTIVKSTWYCNVGFNEVEYSLPVAARKYSKGVYVKTIVSLNDDETYTDEYFQEVYSTIVDKLKMLNEYQFLEKIEGKLKTILGFGKNAIEIKYTLYNGDVLSVPKRTR